MLHQLSAKAMILHEDRLLLLRESATNPEGTVPGMWVLPGGRRQPGETLVQTLHREVMEEAGLKVSIVQEFCHYQLFARIRGQAYRITNVFYICKVDGDPKVTHNDETDLHTWIRPAEAEVMRNVAPPHNWAIGELVEHLA